MAATSLRWGRIVLGGLLGEVLLLLAVIPMRAMGSSESAITVLAVAGSFAVFVPVALWLGRATPRPLLHGALMGGVAAAIYIALTIAGGLFVPDMPPIPWIYYVGHLLKLAGGATGGWLAQRAAGTTAAARARVS
jgi:hypothetical protein